jgi:hypothetical protein
VIQKVMIIVASIYCQFEAIGVHHHGLNRWNATEPITSAINISATCMAGLPAGAPQFFERGTTARRVNFNAQDGSGVPAINRCRTDIL